MYSQQMSAEEVCLSRTVESLLGMKEIIVEASPNEVEDIVFKAVQALNIDGLDVELLSGSSFPDIVCTFKDNIMKFGIEVKSTQKAEFSFMGNSINESTVNPA